MWIAMDFRWEMAHRLPYHKQGCQNIHGHSYRLTVSLEGEPQSNGMVLDYGDLSALVEPLIKELDHSFMCSSDDVEVLEWLRNSLFKMVVVDFYSTAENLTSYFIEFLRPKLKQYKHLREIKVRVFETAATFAEQTQKL